MRLLLLTAISLSLMPNLAWAQTWQEWVKQHPTYPSLEKPTPAPVPASAPAVQPSAPAASPSSSWGSSTAPSSGFPQGISSTQDPLFASTFLEACAYGGGPQVFCECFLSEIQNQYTFQEVEVLGETLRQGDIPPKFQNLVVSCAYKVQ